MTATRIQSIVTISRRRSTRSTSTPPGRANSSQGSHARPVVAETISGFLVCAATKRGAAIVARPLPRAEVVLAVHSFANREPSGSATSSDATWAPAAAYPGPGAAARPAAGVPPGRLDEKFLMVVGGQRTADRVAQDRLIYGLRACIDRVRSSGAHPRNAPTRCCRGTATTCGSSPPARATSWRSRSWRCTRRRDSGPALLRLRPPGPALLRLRPLGARPAIHRAVPDTGRASRDFDVVETTYAYRRCHRRGEDLDDRCVKTDPRDLITALYVKFDDELVTDRWSGARAFRTPCSGWSRCQPWACLYR